jgi:Tol biopolymer transport system component
MTPERWQQIKGVLEQALELSPEERSAFLDRSSPDLALRKEVETLLSASNEVRSSFLESSTLHVTLPPGTKLGDYEVQKLLGSGGMGEVYRARDLRLRRDVAIKVLPSFLSSDKERLRRFEQEAQAAAALNHPNILAVFQMGTYEGSPYLVSELLEGETLREEIKRGPLPARKVIEQGVQIAHGLAAAHEKGIVHRDLKPENLFTTKDGRIKILDFGLAKLKQPQGESPHSSPTIGANGTEPGMVMGTAGYMSPEQVRGKPADHRADIFAFGTILYEMLTGRRAFQKTTAADTMSAILNEEPPAVSQMTPNIPPALQRTIHRCLEKPPEQRFQSASDLAFALEALSDSTVTAASGKLAVASTSRTRRIRAATIAVVLVVIGLLVWWSLPTAVPVVTGVRQLTDDGEPKATSGNLATDGLRVYFGEGGSDLGSIAQVSVSGGQTALLPLRFKYAQVQSIAADGSALFVQPAGTSRQWRQPLPAGEPRDLGIDFCPADLPGGRILYANGSILYAADTGGTNPRKIASVPGQAQGPVVSPDGKLVRFTVVGDDLYYSIWEMNSDGSNLHRLPKTRPESIGEQTGAWTPDGKYFVYQAEHQGRWDLWALPESGGLHRSSAPVQLTNGPLSYENPIVSRDGKSIFAIGSKNRGELIHYDAKSGQFVPYLSGISAIEARVSRDGKWVVYITYPDHILWRSRPDGSDRMQLTFPPMIALYPEISPDSKKIVFDAMSPESVGSAYVISIEGGTPQKVAPFGAAPTWSPDGNSLAYGALVPGKHVFDQGHWFDIYTVDLRTMQVTVLPSTENRYVPWWPKPDLIVADMPDGDGVFEVFDLKTKKWTRIIGPTNHQNWTPSPDGKYLYLLTAGKGQEVKRIRAADFKLEDVMALPGLRLVDDLALSQGSSGQWLGFAADGSVALTRDVGSDEIYALDVKWP